MFLRTAAYLCVTGISMAAQNVSPEGDAGIRKVIASFVEAQNKHDAAAAARLFTAGSPDREPAAKSIADEPRGWTEKTPISPSVRAVRTVRADVAMADVTLRWYTSARGAATSDRMFLLVKENGDWRISAYRRMCRDALP